MIYEHCHRCHSALPEHDDGDLIYCSHCGAPQVLLSEELQSQVDEQAAQDSAAAANAPKTSEFKTDEPLWAGAIRYAGLAVAISAGLALLSAVVPLLGGFSFLWMIASPVVVLGMFHRKYPAARITTGFGARLGLVTGLGISITMVASNAVDLLVMRRGNEPDLVARWEEQMKQQPGAADNPMLQHILERLHTVPEYRAWMVLLRLGLVAVMLSTVTTAAGAYAGYARSRQRK